MEHMEEVLRCAKRLVWTQNQRIERAKKGEPYVPPLFQMAMLAAAIEEVK